MSELKYVVISDVHLGHRRNPTSRIIENLKAFTDNLPKGLDIFFIAGDLFDRLLDNSMPDGIEISLWLHHLLLYCAKHRIRLRILEGTPSHDWRQSSMIGSIRYISGVPVDVEYISALHIEKIDELGISILYVPDEWDVDPNNTYKQVKGLMHDLSLSQVDIAIMHGQFTYQIPNAPATVPRHSEDLYLGIVKHYIHIGHVHTHSYFDRIVAQGSFDRLAHGEEEPKGGVYVNIRRNDSYVDRSYTFIENPNALIFKTINVRGESLDDIVGYLDKQILRYPTGSYIRLKGKPGNATFRSFDEIKKRYALYVLSRVGDDVDKPLATVSIDKDDDNHNQLSITPDNIVTLLADSIKSKYNVTDAQWMFFHKCMSELGNCSVPI